MSRARSVVVLPHESRRIWDARELRDWEGCQPTFEFQKGITAKKATDALKVVARAVRDVRYQPARKAAALLIKKAEEAGFKYVGDKRDARFCIPAYFGY